MSDVKLDCSGLSCPMPIVKLSKAMKDLQPGGVLEVTATDRAFKADIMAWSKKTGNPVENFREEKEKFVARIRKATP